MGKEVRNARSTAQGMQRSGGLLKGGSAISAEQPYLIRSREPSLHSKSYLNQ